MAIPPDTRALDAWSARATRRAAVLMLAGSLVPLLKRSVVFGASTLVWPWHVAGLAVDAEQAAAMATAAVIDHPLAWVLLPAVAGLLGLRLARVPSLAFRGTAGSVAGVAVLGLLLVVLFDGNAILGLAFTPPTAGAGMLMFLGLVACAFLAAATHVARTVPDAVPSRAVVGVASGGLVLLVGVFMLAAEGVWAAWSIRVVCLLVLAYAGTHLAQALRGGVWSSEGARRLPLVVLGWTPVAVLLAQGSTQEPFVEIVIAAGGGTLHTMTGVLKGGLIYGGATLLLAVGIATARAARAAGAPVPTLRRVPGAIVGLLLAVVCAGCTSVPADLRGAVATVEAMLSPRGLSRSAFYAVFPEGDAADFVAFFFSPLGTAEWVADDTVAEGRVALVGAREVLAHDGRPRPGVVPIVPDRVDPRLRRQVVLRAGDEVDVVVVEAYEAYDRPPVFVRERRLARVELAPGVVPAVEDYRRLGGRVMPE